jgi:plasmid stabilization system protein ParE
MNENDPSSQTLGLLIQPAAVDDLRRQAAYLQRESTVEVARRFLHAARAS